MAVIASQVTGRVAADIQPLKKGYAEAKEETTKLGSHFKTTLGNLFSTAGGMLASAGISLGISTIIGSMKGWVDGAIQAQQNQADLNNVLRSTHDAVGLSAAQINAMTQSLKNLTGVDDDVILQGENMLLTFTNIGKTVFPEATQAILDMAVKMNGGKLAGLDLKDTTIQVGKALNNLDYNALTREGVTFTDAQIAQIKALKAAGDTAGAQKVILAELEKEFGGAAKAAGDADPFNRWNLAVGDLGKTVGALILPVLTKLANLITPLAQWIGDHLPGAFDALGKKLAPIGQMFQDLLAQFGGFSGIADTFMAEIKPIQDMFTELFNVLVTQGKQSFDQMKSDWLPIIQQFAGWFTNDLQPAIQKILPSVQGFVNTLVTQGVPAFFAVRDAVIHVVAVVTSLLLPIWEKLQVTLIPLIGYLYDLGNKALKFIIPYVQDAAKEISKFADEMKTRLQPFVENITKAIQAASDIIRKVWGMLWPWISNVIGVAWDLIKLNIGIIWEGIKGAFRIGSDILTGKWGKLWDDIKGIVSGVWDKIKDALGGLWDHIVGAFKGASDAVKKAWNDWIVQPIKDVLNDAILGLEILWNEFLSFLGIGPKGAGAGHQSKETFGKGSGYQGGAGKPHYAEGGITAGGWLTMNEGGGELAFLPGGSLIVPRDLSRQIANAISSGFSGLQSGRGGGDTVNFYGPTSEQVLKEVRMHQQRRAAYYGR